jgi:hypothetical protein
MELPDDVLRLVNEYSMPLTRPDWRTLHIMTYHQFTYEFHKQCCQRWKKLQYVDSDYKVIFNETNYGRIMYSI